MTCVGLPLELLPSVQVHVISFGTLNLSGAGGLKKGLRKEREKLSVKLTIWFEVFSHISTATTNLFVISGSLSPSSDNHSCLSLRLASLKFIFFSSLSCPVKFLTLSAWMLLSHSAFISFRVLFCLYTMELVSISCLHGRGGGKTRGKDGTTRPSAEVAESLSSWLFSAT